MCGAGRRLSSRIACWHGAGRREFEGCVSALDGAARSRQRVLHSRR